MESFFRKKNMFEKKMRKLTFILGSSCNATLGVTADSDFHFFMPLPMVFESFVIDLRFGAGFLTSISRSKAFKIFSGLFVVIVSVLSVCWALFCTEYCVMCEVAIMGLRTFV